jgi:hypothetical protein
VRPEGKSVSVAQQLSALRFFFLKTLKRPWMTGDMPAPKKPFRLPDILSRDEVERLIQCAGIAACCQTEASFIAPYRKHRGHDSSSVPANSFNVAAVPPIRSEALSVAILAIWTVPSAAPRQQVISPLVNFAFSAAS